MHKLLILFPLYKTLEDLARENEIDLKYLRAARLFQQGQTHKGWIPLSVVPPTRKGSGPRDHGSYRQYVIVDGEKIWEAYEGLHITKWNNISLARQVLQQYDHDHAVESYKFMGLVGDYKLVIQLLIEQRYQRKFESVHTLLYSYKGGSIDAGNGLHSPQVSDWRQANIAICIDPESKKVVALFRRAETVSELITGSGRKGSTRLHYWKIGDDAESALP